MARRPRQTEKCNYGHCSDGFVWRPDPWLQCEGRCQSAKQKRKLRCYTLQGQKVPNNKCNPSMKPQKRRRCSNSPKCHPESCLDFHSLQNRKDDGDYQIYIKGRMITVYCHGMNTRNPQEYINLTERNFAVIYSSALNFKITSSDSCLSNDVTNECDCSRNDYGYTEYFKVALNRTSLTLITDDFTFSTTFYGKPVPYATAGDCFRRPTCPQGAFSVSLKGTDFYVASSAKWMSNSGSIHATIHRTENDQVIHGKCGGFCDTCGPDPKLGLALDVFMFT
ncbi:A disintegrin and metalloproteinase with thrombospondin motifs 9, partial [Stegodyphus mimosarum]